MEARPLLINTETDEVKLLRDAASTSTKWTRIWIVVIFSVLSLLQVWILISRLMIVYLALALAATAQEAAVVAASASSRA